MKINDQGLNEALHYFEDEEIRRHIEVRYAHRIIDYKVAQSDRTKVFPFKSKECTEDDFSEN